MTPGSDPRRTTIDGINIKFFEDLAERIQQGKYDFRPTRIQEIPKANGKVRILGISDPREKIVQKAIEVILSGI